jgi:DNA replication protein DnaC
MADVTIELLKTQLRQLRLPTMGREFEKLARDAAAANQTFAQFLLRLTELELATRAANAVTTRIKDAGFPVEKDFDTYDFSVMPQLSKPKILELARCEWIAQKSNCCLVGSHGTGKTHISIGLGLAACRAGLRVRFFTAAELVSRLEKEQKQYTLDRFLTQVAVHSPGLKVTDDDTIPSS